MIAVTTSWEEFPSLWGPLLGEVWEAIRATRTRAGRNVMLYLDDRPAVEVGVEVEEPFAPRGRVIPSTLPAGPVVSALAPGAPTVQGIAAAHERAARWADEHGRALSGVRWEIYSHHHEDATQMWTRVHLALAPAG